MSLPQALWFGFRSVLRFGETFYRMEFGLLDIRG
jgi:hypothetical protein